MKFNGLLLLFVLTVAPAPLSAQEPLAKGAVVPRVECSAKPEQSYALYIPANYVPDRKWPILYILDPGARGRVPLDLAKDAAEKYGFLLAGSNNSRNGPSKIQLEAASAMWDDTHRRLSIDDRRIYYAGFSGGARAAATITLLCKGCAAGAFLHGAGFAPDLAPQANMPFGVFATVGSLDFNYTEVVALDETLDSLGAPHALRRFEGPHRWAPGEVWDEALEWFELEAMKTGHRPRDPALISAALARAQRRAEALDAAGDAYLTHGEYHRIAQTFAGLADVAASTKRAAELKDLPAVREGAKRERKQAEEQFRLQSEILSAAEGLRDPSPGRLDLRSQVEDQLRRLCQDAAREKRPERKNILKRVQAGVFASFIQRGDSFFDSKDFVQARLFYELAREANPDLPGPYLALAFCAAASGNRKDTLRALKQAREKGLSAEVMARLLQTAPELAPYRDDLGFRSLTVAEPPH